MSPEVVVFEDASAFHFKVSSFVAADPAGTTVLATVLNDVVGGARSYPGARWYAVCDDHGAGKVIGAAMHTPPHPLWFSPMPDSAATAVAEVALDLADRPTHLAGERRAAECAAAHWTAIRPSTTTREARGMRLYVLDELVAPKPIAGMARVATTSDSERIVQWWQAFAVEADSLGGGHARDAVAARIAGHGAVLLWELDGKPWAMAGHTAPVEGLARLGPVYTPPAHRRQGYGSAITYACARHALESSSTGVVLFTDLANPTSNSIYQQLGFRPDRDYVEIALTER